MPIGDPRNQLPHCTACGELNVLLDARGLCDPCPAAAVVDQLQGGLQVRVARSRLPDLLRQVEED